jgi:hypothetical protein
LQPRNNEICRDKRGASLGENIMRLLRSSALAAVLALTTATLVGPSVAQAQIAIGISVNVPPPPLPIYVQPPIPAPNYLWTPGNWGWNAGVADYYWVPGTWVQPPQVGFLWTPSYWGWQNGAYAFNAGYWGAHVGFYGGINFGFGYGGHGYEGGYWNGGNFFYNRSVNNVTNVHITNVYNRQVTETHTRTSFNGGKGGVNARPTPEEEAAAHEQHVAATPEQVNQEHAAAANPDQLASHNHGNPPIAATARAGVLTGPGVVHAAHASVTGSGRSTAAVQRQAHVRASHSGPGAPVAKPPVATKPPVTKPPITKPPVTKPPVAHPPRTRTSAAASSNTKHTFAHSSSRTPPHAHSHVAPPQHARAAIRPHSSSPPKAPESPKSQTPRRPER